VIAIFTQHLLYHLAVLVAWTGALAFVASLAYLVYFQVVTLASSDGDAASRPVNILLNTLMFSLFAVHHSLLARPRAKDIMRRFAPPRLERAIYVWTASILLAAVCALWQPLAGSIYSVEGTWRLPLWVLQGVGVLTIVQAARALSAFELAGIHQAQGRRVAGTLKAVGPFRVVRHPIYLGWILIVCATPTMTVNRVVFAVMSSAYLILAIPWEEKSLVAEFGDRYREYQQAVRWRLLPGIW
jgi:methanethiol S-methyltransferase